MRTLILHLTNGEVKAWETNFGNTDGEGVMNIRTSASATGFFKQAMAFATPAFALCTDKSLINLNHVVWMEEKQV